MLYIIGLGLNADGISKYGLEILKRCKRVYLENYTVEFPYSIGELEAVIGKKIMPAGREFVESLEIVDISKKMDIALLVYGSPLTATTHISLIQEARSLGIKCKVLYNASVFDAVAETGLQLYKFGKIISMPSWQKDKSYTPDSFIKTIQENQSMKAHTLLLADIGLSFNDALSQLEESANKYDMPIKRLIVCSRLGTKHKKIIYSDINELRELKDVKSPYCIIIPSKLHFIEKEALEWFKD